jgi:VWFA-related protein
MNYTTDTHAFRIGLLLLAITLGAASVAAQSGRRISKPASDQNGGGVLKIGTVEISLSVTVRDTLGKAVNGLRAEDFFIYDNGQRYQPMHFEHRHVPVNLVLLLDATGSFFDDEEAIHNALLSFRRKLPPADRIAVMHFSDEVSLDQDWSNEESSFREALKRNEHRGSKAALYDALLLAAAKLSETEGRRAILLLTSGLNTAGQVRLSEALSAIQHADAALYVLSETEAIASAIRGKSSNAEILASLPKLETAERNLTWLAEQSGGGIYFPLKLGSLDWMLAELAEEFRAQYLLTYQLSADSNDAPGNRLVEVLVQGGHKAQVRSGYSRRNASAGSKLISSSPTPR